jgi:hypothetical protein
MRLSTKVKAARMKRERGDTTILQREGEWTIEKEDKSISRSRVRRSSNLRRLKLLK